MATLKGKHRILITGPPGIGKTTLIISVCKELNKQQKTAVGFYTEEVRSNGQRTGFDVISLSGNRGPLARIQSNNTCPYRVGKYSVNLKSFEEIALPTIKKKDDAIIVIDEIGKMELFSKLFEQSVKELFINGGQSSILATIPILTSRPMPLVDSLRSRNDIDLITVTRENRNSLVQTIVEAFSK